MGSVKGGKNGRGREGRLLFSFILSYIENRFLSKFSTLIDMSGKGELSRSLRLSLKAG
jgi:hypothetical protein